ncbi:MAG: hypothetical protein AAGK37_11085 [Pseudomonadota bacterium]
MTLSDILNAMIWRSRIALRLVNAPLFAGHGLADTGYRPQRLPYASVVGPLNLEIEPDRDLPASSFIFAQSPGYLAGRDLDAAAVLPPAGQLHFRFDGVTRLSAAVDFSGDAGAVISDPVGRRAARVMTDAIAASVTANGALENGVPVVDPDRLNELGGIAVRWQSARRRFVVRSGRRSVIESSDQISAAAPSGVTIQSGADDLADALGFADESALVVPGRIARHRLTSPRAVAVDLRFDLWAGAQQHLADLLERWAVLTPTRGQIQLCPCALRAPVVAGARELRILPGAWPSERWTLAHIDMAGELRNRVDNRPIDIAGGALAVDGHLELEPTQTASTGVWEAEALPPPDRPDHPAPTGYALMVEFSLLGAPADGERVEIASLSTSNGTALSLALSFRTRDGTLEGVVELRAERQGAGAFSPRDFLIDPTGLGQSRMVHVVLEAPEGRFFAYVDGDPLPLDDAAAPLPRAAGQPLGEEEMTLTLGTSANNDRTLRVRRVELLGRPLGPVDPRLPNTTARADRWAVGDPVGLARSYDTREATDTFTAIVTAVEDDRLILDRPLPRSYDAARTVVFKRALFFSQRQWRRRDDLMNRLYRLSAEYRVSAFLEERIPATTAPIVETPDVEIFDLTRVLAGEAAAAEGASSASPPVPPRMDRPGVTTEFVVASPPSAPTEPFDPS